MAKANPAPTPAPLPEDSSWLKKIRETPRVPLITAAVLILLDIGALVFWFFNRSLPLPLVLAGVIGTFIIACLLPVLARISKAPQKEVSRPATALIYTATAAAVFFVAAFCYYTNSHASAYTKLANNRLEVESAKLQAEIKKVEHETKLLTITPAAADWEDDNIPDRADFAHESKFLEVTSPNPTNDKDESLAWEASMDKWKDWLRLGCKPETEGEKLARQTLVAECDFDSGFDQDYNDIHGKIELDHGIQLKWGACFLVKEIELPNKVKTPILRQQPFLIEVKDSGKFHRNEFQLLAPRKGERLIFILRVQKLEGMVGALPPAATQYGVNIKTSGKRKKQ